MLHAFALLTVVMSPPPFSSLDRTAGETGAGADFAVQSLDDSNSDGGSINDAHAVRTDLYAEYALTGMFGLTASLPLVWTDVDSDDIWGIGAIHLGGYRRFEIADGHQLVVRAGAQAPTESYPTDGRLTDTVVLRATAFQRLEDPMVSSGAVWLRGGASYRLRVGPVVGQAESLVDVPVGADLWTRVVFAGGVAWAPGRWAIAGEMVAAGFPFVDDRSPNGACPSVDVLQATFCEETSTVATLSARLNADPVVLSAWFSKPLDDVLRHNDINVYGLGARSSF